MALPVRPEEVPKDLICAVCLSLPLEPCSLKMCSHVFCESCIHECLDVMEVSSSGRVSCPVCREEFAEEDVLSLQEESALAHRIWSSIPVKCEHPGCSWKGSLSDYASHRAGCDAQKSQQKRDKHVRALEKTVEILEAKNAVLMQDIAELQRGKRLVRSENLRLRRANESSLQWKDKFATLAREFDDLKTLVASSLESPLSNGKGGYAYDRTNVARLAKLVCQNLEAKPVSIDAHRIFQCVENINMDLRKAYTDNPEYLYADVRMLFGICLASNWFTENQFSRIRAMADESGWT